MGKVYTCLTHRWIEQLRMNVLNTKSVQIARFLFRVTITIAAFSPEVLTTGS